MQCRAPTRRRSAGPSRVGSCLTIDWDGRYYRASMAKHMSYVIEMARKGAGHKYEELKTEMAILLKQFPHLSSQKGGRSSEVRFARAIQAEGPARRRGRKPMSATAKKAVSVRMKKYWAKRKAAES